MGASDSLHWLVNMGQTAYKKTQHTSAEDVYIRSSVSNS